MPLTTIEAIVLKQTLVHLQNKIAIPAGEPLATGRDGFQLKSSSDDTLQILSEEIDSMTNHELPEPPVQNMDELYRLMTRAAEQAGLDVHACYHTYSRNTGNYTLRLVFTPPEGFEHREPPTPPPPSSS